MNGACWIPAPRCGFVGVGVGWHHWLGRDVNGEYVKPEILMALCQPDCHQGGVHRLLQLAGLDGPMEATPGVIIGRIAVNLGWLVWDRPPTVTLPGDVVADIADVLGVVGRGLRRAEGSL